MTFIPRTPESQLERNDSKNPSTTCRGITRNGRPCRRDITPSRLQGFKSPNGQAIYGIESGQLCWQHREQADEPKVEQRETLEDLGFDDWDLKNGTDRSTKKTTEKIDVSPGEESAVTEKHHVRPERKPQQAHSAGPSLLSLLCCMTLEEPQEKYSRSRPYENSGRRRREDYHQPNHRTEKNKNVARLPNRAQLPSRQQTMLARPSLNHKAHSETEELLAFIPRRLPPHITSSLLNELAKPISPMDEEGYIYMFWLSDALKAPTPSSAVATSLLSPNRRVEEAQAGTLLKQTALDSQHRHVLVKIGRASNVQRRLNEWSRQCGFDLSLIRYYPHLTTASTSRVPTTTMEKVDRGKVPHVHRVERLIHLELADSRFNRLCSVCRKNHREWFAVEASQAGIRHVDGVIQRWVRWADQHWAKK